MDGSLLNEDLQGMLDAVPASSLGYQDWVNVGMALKAEGFGLDAWEAWSAADAARYHPGECARKWAGFGAGGQGRINGGTLAQMAMERGYEPPRGEDAAVGWDVAEVTWAPVRPAASGAPPSRSSRRPSPPTSWWTPPGWRVRSCASPRATRGARPSS